MVWRDWCSDNQGYPSARQDVCSERHSHSQPRIDMLHGARSARFFDSDGVRTHFTDRGRGEPAVLVHGMTSSSERWEQNGLAPASEPEAKADGGRAAWPA